MEIFDKEQRNEIYTEALDLLLQEISEKCTTSTCDILDAVIYDLHADGFVDHTGNAKTIPEWYAQEPKQSHKPKIYDKFRKGFNDEPKRIDYWWTHSPQGYQARVRALKRCINLTK